MSNFAIHPTSFGAGNLPFSGDNVGFTERIVEEELAARAGGQGVADRGDGPQAYAVASRRFAVAPARLEPGEPVVEGTTARVRARHPDPGDGALLALPRLVQTGSATLEVTPPGEPTRTVTARPDAATGTFAAPVPAGSRVVLGGVRDGCGNRG